MIVWYDIVNFSLILSCIILISVRYNSLPNEIRLFLFYYVLTFILELFSEFLIVDGKNNLFLYHFFIPIQYAILSFYFLNLLVQTKNRKVMFAVLTPILLMWAVSFYLNGVSQYFSFASIIKNILISFYVLIYFRRVFVGNSILDKDISTNVWICTGLFINCLGNFFIEGSMNYLMDADRNISTKLYYLHIGLDFLFYIIFVLAIIFKKYE